MAAPVKRHCGPCLNNNFLSERTRPAKIHVMKALLLVIAILGLVTTSTQAASKSDFAKSVAATKRAEEKVARKWILDLPKHARKWLATVQHKPQPGEPWGLFTFSADSKIPYSIPSTRIAWYYAYLCGGIEKMPGYHRNAKPEMAAWVQKHQDPKSHQFIDPLIESCVPNIDDSKVRYTFREAVSKYAVGLLGDCGAKPLYPYTPGANEEGEIDPEHYLKFIKDGDWDKAAWGIGSHAALQTVQLFEQVNKGREDLIPTLIEGTEFIVSKQNPRTGMWGGDKAAICQQIGGAVKVIGRFQWYMGMISPHMDKLADSIIANHRSGAFYEIDASPCVPRNVAEMAYACMEASDYRRDELREVLIGVVAELRRYSREDGSCSETWGGTNSVGWCQAVVSPKSKTPRSDVVGSQLVADTAFRIFERVGWKGQTWPKQKNWRTAIEEADNKYKISCDANGKVSVTPHK